MGAETNIQPDTLSIWNAVSKTDPAHTKRVNQRGGFTAISAHYQILAATKQFGPIGIGWGYESSDPILLGDVVTVGVTIWHGARDNTFGPIWGGADLRDSKGKLDSDAPKKAGTDGLTKGLSQLGFNADVFLGRFDDNKYIEQVRQEFAEQAREEDPPAKVPGISKIKNTLRGVKIAGDALNDLDAFNELLASNRDDLKAIKDANHSWWTGDGEDFEGYKAWIKRRREELTPKEDGQLSMLIASLKGCDTLPSLTNWMATNESIIDELDDADRRSFELAYSLQESNIMEMDKVSA